MNIIQLQPKLIKFTEEIARQLLPKFQTQEELDKLLEHHHISAKSSITKSEIAGWYGVHRMTFNKWIKGFGKPIFPIIRCTSSVSIYTFQKSCGL